LGKYLAERQMTGSGAFVDAPSTYEKLAGAGHWLQVDALDALAALLLRHWQAVD
jgi:pimeloyl-ACP methyl ester carboxylesterase